MANLVAQAVISFAAREGNEEIVDQVNLAARLYGVLPKKKMEGRVGIVNIAVGGQPSTGLMGDFGTLNTPGSSIPKQGYVEPRALYSALGLGRIAINVVSGEDDSADLLETQMDFVKADLGRQVGRGMYGTQLAEDAPKVLASQWALDANDGYIAKMSMQFDNCLSEFREGEAVNYRVAGAGVAYTIAVENVDVIDDNTIEVRFANTVPGIEDRATHTNAILDALTAGPTDTFYLRGQFVGTGTGSSTVPLAVEVDGLQKITSKTQALYTLPVSQRGWTGLTTDSFGPLIPSKMLTKWKLVKQLSGASPTHVVLGSAAVAAFGSGAISNSTFAGLTVQPRKQVDGKFDLLGPSVDEENGMAFLGKPVIVDENCPDAEMYLINKNFLEVGEWQKIMACDEGGSPLLLSRVTFSHEVQFQTIINLVTRKRRAHMRLKGLTIG